MSFDRILAKKDLTTNVTHDLVLERLVNAATVCDWSFDNALGKTFKEKFPSLYVKLIELTNVVVAKSGQGFFCIVVSPLVLNIIEESGQLEYSCDHFPIGYNEVYPVGVLSRRWRVYCDPLLGSTSKEEVVEDSKKESFGFPESFNLKGMMESSGWVLLCPAPVAAQDDFKANAKMNICGLFR